MLNFISTIVEAKKSFSIIEVKDCIRSKICSLAETFRCHGQAVLFHQASFVDQEKQVSVVLNLMHLPRKFLYVLRLAQLLYLEKPC